MIRDNDIRAGINVIATTVSGSSVKTMFLAEEIAKKLRIPLVQRSEKSLEELRKEYQVSNIVVATAKGPVVYTPGGEYFFHLSMADLRIKNIENGNPDHMLTAMQLTGGMSVLDCTLGLASDALVASYFVGKAGEVVGLESSPIIHFIAEWGLKHFTSDNFQITEALRRIEAINTDAVQYLVQVPDKSFDVVFFDPMFRRPIYSSSNVKPLRYLADMRSLEIEAVKEARRVAKKRIVIKETRGSQEFKRFGCTSFSGGKYSSVQYGIIEVGG